MNEARTTGYSTGRPVAAQPGALYDIDPPDPPPPAPGASPLALAVRIAGGGLALVLAVAVAVLWVQLRDQQDATAGLARQVASQRATAAQTARLASQQAAIRQDTAQIATLRSQVKALQAVPAVPPVVHKLGVCVAAGSVDAVPMAVPFAVTAPRAGDACSGGGQFVSVVPGG